MSTVNALITDHLTSSWLNGRTTTTGGYDRTAVIDP
jgi:hypothetical protein